MLVFYLPTIDSYLCELVYVIFFLISFELICELYDGMFILYMFLMYGTYVFKTSIKLL